jgi:type VI secretion system secreted protein VgrG
MKMIKYLGVVVSCLMTVALASAQTNKSGQRGVTTVPTSNASAQTSKAGQRGTTTAPTSNPAPTVRQVTVPIPLSETLPSVPVPTAAPIINSTPAVSPTPVVTFSPFVPNTSASVAPVSTRAQTPTQTPTPTPSVSPNQTGRPGRPLT